MKSCAGARYRDTEDVAAPHGNVGRECLKGKRRDPDPFRDRILARAVARASANRETDGLPLLPAITPHSLRRSWATFCAMVGRDPKWVAAQIGHVNPKSTFYVYQQLATRRYIDEQTVWALMRFADEPAERAPSRQVTRLVRGDPRASDTIAEGEFDLDLERLSDPDFQSDAEG